MSSSRKKAIVRMWERAGEPKTHAGYLPASRFLAPDAGTMDLLDPAGRLLPIELSLVRYVAFVRDFNLEDQVNPERLLRKMFLARPRSEGLWVRVTLLDGELLEGLAPLDLSLLDDAILDRGVSLVPPDVRSNTQRLFLPRTSIAGLQVLGVVTTPSRPEKTVRKKHEGELDLPFTGQLFADERTGSG